MTREIPRDDNEFSQSELNFYGLLKIALLLDCQHIMEWESIKLYGHGSLITLSQSQQKEVYHNSKKGVLCELKRAKNPEVLAMILANSRFSDEEEKW